MRPPRVRSFGRAVPPSELSPLDGVLLIDKPAGPTSHDVVDRIRRALDLRRVGHGGTLDPAATGLLVILVGRGTKLSDRFMASDKGYEGVLRLGTATDTQDADGEVVREAPFDRVTREQLEAATERLRGDLSQTPPMVSAVKVNGVPLYKHARKGREVERKPRLIHVYEFRVTAFDPPDARFVIRCTKGTYVRTLCADVGEALGCGAHLAALRRTQSGAFDVAEAIPLADALALDRAALIARILPVRQFA